uniref:Uncharacterized protein n=1 Tax=Oryza sativa subsp. japonica TaxID=39947 RepID=Q5Z804_ORYSJ|nr:hypothetical protein [Oryza sativa Japonica Group]BAD54057.1 hypothetical protein [Oryza sativa Japonica Group]
MGPQVAKVSWPLVNPLCFARSSPPGFGSLGRRTAEETAEVYSLQFCIGFRCDAVAVIEIVALYWTAIRPPGTRE